MSLEKKLWWKCQILVEGIAVDSDVIFPQGIHTKRIHLYAHSMDKAINAIPDDIMIGDSDESLICRVRYHKSSPLTLVKEGDNYAILDTRNKEYLPISFVPEATFSKEYIEGESLDKVCSFLGQDLVGIIPSNYCFYFKDGSQCRFCEILPTYQKEVEYSKAMKSIPLMTDAIRKVVEVEKCIKHVAFTTGNIRTYDYTFQMLIDIGKNLKENRPIRSVKDVLATLMPPDNFELIPALANTYFNKVYYALEVYEKNHFKIVCPGKHDYGYEKLMSAFAASLDCFGKGNVYTNLVYGIQSLDHHLNPESINHDRENDLSLIAVKELLQKGVIPAFTLYHYAGYNKIGKIKLSTEHVFSFFKQWGELVYHSNLVPKERDSVIFSPNTLSNTAYNDGFLLAKKNNQKLRS
jgi:hypothetical protein